MLKKILYVCSIISIVLLIFFIVTTYAKYASESDKNTILNLTSWRLRLNDTDITDDSDYSSILTPVSTSTTYISDGVIAPASTGYFDIEIDSTDTNLSFSYVVTVSNEDSSIEDYKVTGYSINDFNTVLPYNTSITGNVLYNKLNKIDSTVIRVYVEWDDSVANVSNNASDTAFAINDTIATFDVDVSISQIIDTYVF